MSRRWKHSGTRKTYTTWVNMRLRCFSENIRSIHFTVPEELPFVNAGATITMPFTRIWVRARKRPQLIVLTMMGIMSPEIVDGFPCRCRIEITAEHILSNFEARSNLSRIGRKNLDLHRMVCVEG